MADINNRDHIRYPFSAGKWVKIVKKEKNLNDFKMFQLIDISQSGISFKSHDAKEFKRGEEFYILEIGDRVLDEPIVVKVKYLQPLDQFGVDIKVGAEFITKI